MKKILITLAAVALAACSGPAFDPASVADATPEQVTRVEPLSWWTGMKMPLQLLVQGENISEYEVAIEGGNGVAVEKINKADSPNYIFVDVKIASNAQPGTYYIVFSKDGQSFKYPYEIAAREEGSAERKSFTTLQRIRQTNMHVMSSSDAMAVTSRVSSTTLITSAVLVLQPSGVHLFLRIISLNTHTMAMLVQTIIISTPVSEPMTFSRSMYRRLTRRISRS